MLGLALASPNPAQMKSSAFSAAGTGQSIQVLLSSAYEQMLPHLGTQEEREGGFKVTIPPKLNPGAVLILLERLSSWPRIFTMASQ